jgi:hypothetical protein
LGFGYSFKLVLPGEGSSKTIQNCDWIIFEHILVQKANFPGSIFFNAI